MLTCELLKNHAGVALISDYKSLQNFYEVLHEVNEKSVLVKDKEGSLLGLAYDLRKAIEKQRRIYKPPADTPEIGPRFGVEILWPVIR